MLAGKMNRKEYEFEKSGIMPPTADILNLLRIDGHL